MDEEVVGSEAVDDRAQHRQVGLNRLPPSTHPSQGNQVSFGITLLTTTASDRAHVHDCPGIPLCVVCPPLLLEDPSERSPTGRSVRQLNGQSVGRVRDKVRERY